MKRVSNPIHGAPLGDPDRDYMTPAEMSDFNTKRKYGHITFFRVGNCEKCGKEIHAAKRYCSKTCKVGGRDDEQETERMD